MCLIPLHFSPLSDTSIPMRQYQLFDKAGESEACFQPRTLWCTSCHIVIFKGSHFLLGILGLHTSLIYLLHNKANDHLVSMRRSIT